MLKNISAVAGVLLLGAIVFLPQLADAHPRCHRGSVWRHGHCYRVHHRNH